MRYPSRVQQVLGSYQALPVRTQAAGPPAADGDGFAMSVFNSTLSPTARRPKRYLIRVDISAVGTSCQLTLYAKDKQIGSGGGGAWGIPVDPSGNFGVLANNTALPSGKTYLFAVEDIGPFTEISLAQSNNQGGTPVCTAQIAAWTDYVENR